MRRGTVIRAPHSSHPTTEIGQFSSFRLSIPLGRGFLLMYQRRLPIPTSVIDKYFSSSLLLWSVDSFIGLVDNKLRYDDVADTTAPAPVSKLPKIETRKNKTIVIAILSPLLASCLVGRGSTPIVMILRKSLYPHRVGRVG